MWRLHRMSIIKECDQIINGVLGDVEGLTGITSITVDGVQYNVPGFIIALTDESSINQFLLSIALTNCQYIYNASLTTYSFVVTQSEKNFQNIEITEGYGTSTPVSFLKSFSAKSNCHYRENQRKGCMDPAAINYDPTAETDSGLCQYYPGGDLETITCCIGSQEYEFAQKIKYGVITTDNSACAIKKLFLKQRSLEYVKEYIPVNTVLADAIAIQAEVLATAQIIFSFLKTTGFSVLSMSINGVIVANTTPEAFYSNIASLVQALYASFLSSGSAYTIVKSSITMDVTAPVGSGTSGNYYPIIINGTQVYFKIIDTIITVGATAYYGCYDSDANQVIFVSSDNKLIVLDAAGLLIQTLDLAESAGEVLYNPNTLRKYVSLLSGHVAVIEITLGASAEVLPKLSTDGTITYFCQYNAVNKRMYFSNTLGTDSGAGATGSVSVYDGNVIPEVKLADVPFPINSFPRGIAIHPISGLIYVICDGNYSSGGFACTVQVLDDTNVIIASGPLTSTAPTYGIIVENTISGIYELWVSAANGIVEVLNATTLAFIENIDTGFIMQLICLKQHSNGYVYMSSNAATGGFAVIRVSDRVFIKPMESLNATLIGIVENTVSKDVYIAAPFWSGGGNPASILHIHEYDDVIDLSYEMTGGEAAVSESADAILTTDADNCGITEAEHTAMVQLLLQECDECCNDRLPEDEEVSDSPVNPEEDPCDISKIDIGIIHCLTTYIACVDSTGNMAYLDYYYDYYYSFDQVTWIPFGNHSSQQDINGVPGFGVNFLFFKTVVRCSQYSVDSRVFIINQDAYLPFYNFLYAVVNGVLQPILRSVDGINYFGSGDIVEIIQPNTNFSTAVTGPLNWNSSDETFAPGTLLAGTYEATFTDISGGINNGCSGGNGKEFIIAIMPTPVILGPGSKCYADADIVLDAGTGYDSYQWFKDGINTGQTTQTVTLGNNDAGNWTVKVEDYDYPGVFLTSAVQVFVVFPELPAFSYTIKAGGCQPIETAPGEYQIITGNYFIVVATPGFDSYVFNGIGQVSNEYVVNGAIDTDILGSINGCYTSPAHIKVVAVDTDIAYTIEELAPAPNLRVKITFTDPRIQIPGFTINVYDSAGTTVYTDQLIIDHTCPPGDVSVSAELASIQIDPATGCNMAWILIYP